MRRVTWTLLLLAAATVCHAESLAEIAARTKAARDKAKPAAKATEESTPAKEYGQEDLERVVQDPAEQPTESTAQTTTEDKPRRRSSGESAGEPSEMRRLEEAIRQWRARCQPLRGTVEYRRRSLADLEAYEERSLERRPRGERRSDLKERLDAQVAEARTSLARAEEELSACEDDARRDGVSPSQLE